MGEPYLSARTRTFFIVPPGAMVRDHRVERLASFAEPTWAHACPQEIVVVRGVSSDGRPTHAWCLRLWHKVAAPPLLGEGLRSCFLAPIPKAVRRGIAARLRADPLLAESALLGECLVGALTRRLDPRASGWTSVHDEDAPDVVQRFGVASLSGRDYPLWLCQQVSAARRAVRQLSGGVEEGGEEEMDDSAGSPDSGSSRPVTVATPQRRARILAAAHALQDMLEEMEPNVGEGRYLAASNRLQALVDAC
jgi:hypothetical protein